jgi:uncharacterized repeat protein (TIGR01451 family)
VRTRLALLAGAAAAAAAHAQPPAAPGPVTAPVPPRYNGPPSVGAAPQYANQYDAPARPPANPGRPRLTQPVVTPSGEVRNAAVPPVPPPDLPPPNLSFPNDGSRVVRVEAPPTITPEMPALPVAEAREPRVTPLAGPPADPLPPFDAGPAGPVGGNVLPPAEAARPAPSPSSSPAPALLPSSAGMTPPPVAAGLPAKQTPNVEVTMAAPESVGVGLPLTYELVVRNVGTVPVTNVRVEDEPPARGTLVNTDPPAEMAGDRLTWAVGPLDPGAERRIKVTVKLADEGEVRSRATVSFSAVVDARVRVTRPRVTVAVTGPESAKVGEKVPFQMRLTNSGSGTATRIVLQARFSDGLVHPHGALIEAELANLPAGQTKTIPIEAVAARAGGHACTITAAADGNPPESARAGTSIVEPLLKLQQAGPARCLVRGEPSYTIDLANPGTAATDPLTVASVLPEGFEFVQASDGGAFLPGSRTVTWRLPGLPAGQTRQLALRVRAVGPTDGVIRTAAQATPSGIDPAAGVTPAGVRTSASVRPLEARAETSVRAEGVPALRFEVTAAEGVVEVGKDAVYEVRVVNQGTGPCTGVQLVADLADGTVAAGASGPSTARGAGQQVVFDPLPQLGVRQEVAYRVRVRGTQPGDMRFRVRLTCNEVKSPTVKEENTRFFKE